MFFICDSWTGLEMNVTLLKFIDFPLIGSVGIFSKYPILLMIIISLICVIFMVTHLTLF